MTHALLERRGRGTPMGWLLLLVIGQGASLALIQSGKGVTYPHYQFSRLFALPHALALGVLLVQAVVVLWGMRGEWADVSGWIRRTFRPLVFMAGVAVLVVLSAAASRDLATYAAELVLSTVIQGLALGTAVLLARSMGDAAVQQSEGRLRRYLGGTATPERGRFLDPFALACAATVVVVCAFLALVVYEGVPHVPDEIVYLLQARYFADGRVQLPAPPVAAAFDIDLMYYDANRYFSPVPPGWPAILALGVRLGVPLLVNPILSGVSVLLLHALFRRIESPRSARLATLLLATSPWFLFLGMSLMTHSATLALTLAAALGVATARAKSAVWPAALAGLAVGMVGLIRPLEGLAVALVLGLWSLGATHRLFQLLPSAALTLVTVLVSALIRPYNQALTGSARTFPIMMYVDKYYSPGANDLGFGPNRGMGWGGLDPWPGHGLKDVVLNAMLNGAALNIELFAWSSGSLVLVAGLLMSGRLRRSEWAMIVIIAFVVGLHAIYWFGGGPDFAARYWYLILVPCIALTVRAPAALFGGGTPGATRTTMAMLALCMSSVLTWMPWRSVEKYHGYRLMGSDMRAFVREHSLGRALVLVRGRRHPDYHEAALENPLDLHAAATVYAWDRTADVRRAAVEAYPDRPVYIIDGPTITEHGYRIVAGPLPPGSLATGIPSSADIPKVVGDAANDGMQRRTP